MDDGKTHSKKDVLHFLICFWHCHHYILKHYWKLCFTLVHQSFIAYSLAKSVSIIES